MAAIECRRELGRRIAIARAAIAVNAVSVTALLRAWAAGDGDALDRLAPLVESELRQVARAYMARERAGHTLQPTALVNEVFLRLIESHDVNWQHRAHFFGIAARLMRRVLVDHARSHRYQKRGGGAQRVTLDEALAAVRQPEVDVLALDAALTKLARIDERRCKVIELRYFAGLTVEETAIALDVSMDTVKRDWRLARLWLLKEMEAAPLT
jgi:RNA polymerase sigma-70 factor, ECF subfamily